MRVLFWLLAVFAAAVALVILGRVGAGYVMFVYPPYRVELSLPFFVVASLAGFLLDRKSTRLNSSHVAISYAVFCLKKKKQTHIVQKADEREQVDSDVRTTFAHVTPTAPCWCSVGSLILLRATFSAPLFSDPVLSFFF